MIGKGDNGLQLAFQKQCQLNQDPYTCSPLTDQYTAFVSFLLENVDTQNLGFIRDCQILDETTVSGIPLLI